MTATTEYLIEAALTLPEEDRLRIAETLIASLPPTDRPPFDESWREVIKRRSAELRSGQVAGVPWDEVRKKPRVLGLHAGMYEVAPDFDEPLPDEFWLGDS
ncbi:MAG: addiction module protein [Gemmataceae bacterium]